MAVGASGVINAGSLYMMTPTRLINTDEPYDYKTLKGEFWGGFAAPGDASYDKVMQRKVPLNASATITVLGKINVTDNVGLYAPKIAVGKNISGQELNGIAKDATVAAAASTTGVVEFKD